jgi:endonuclease YncB( thermonuclease family)
MSLFKINIRKYLFCLKRETETQEQIIKKELEIPEIPEIQKKRIIKWEDTTAFTIPITGGQVLKVYDGDSITIAAHLPIENSPLFRFSVRLNGIDTPEIKAKNEDEKAAAKDARDALSNLILHKEVILKNVGTEKYGRILADVYLDNLCINEWLIKENYAVKYDGGTKISPTSWLKSTFEKG